MVGASVSGMRVAQARLDSSAHDVANMSTAGFRPSRVEVAEAAGRSGAVVTGISAAGQAPPQGLSGTDLAEEIPEQIVAGAVYGANAAALRAQDETTRSLLDVLAR